MAPASRGKEKQTNCPKSLSGERGEIISGEAGDSHRGGIITGLFRIDHTERKTTMSKSYQDFIAAKAPRIESAGIEPCATRPMLFDWQAEIVRWAIRKGR